MAKRFRESQEGIILQLQKLSVDDGEGIRTVIFLPGCPLRCQWCANPEAWDLKACRDGAAAFLCEQTSVSQVVSQVERDAVFFRFSGGGVTFSGGEPTVQEGFLRALTEAFDNRGISMWMETCGHFNFDDLKDVLVKMEHIFYDIKCMDSALHKSLTGVDNDLILENAAKLHQLGVPVTVRIPAIKDVNFTEENLTETARFMRENLPGAAVGFLPYHNLGKEKYEKLEMENSFREFAAPSKQEIAEAKALFKKHGIGWC